MTKEYKCVSENLMRYFVKASSLLAKFDEVELRHVPRIDNQEANDVAHLAYGYKVSKEKLKELVKIKGKLRPEELEVLTIDDMAPSD